MTRATTADFSTPARTISHWHAGCFWLIRQAIVTLVLADVVGLIVAILGGAAVGVERQRSGHATGPNARLGGIRTFTLLGTCAGIGGYLIKSGNATPAVMLIGASLVLIIAGYVRASERDIDATTEVAAVVVVGTGVLAGIGLVQLSAALTTLTVLLLAEKPRLHGFVARLDEPVMLAAARFAVMSAVILPLLPEGPFGPGPGVRPRDLWILVLLFSGLSFVGFVTQRASSAGGYPLTGLLGGLVSSTSVALAFARLSASHPQHAAALATGAVAASTILFVRVAVVVAILNRTLIPDLAGYLVVPGLVALAAGALAWRSLRDTEGQATPLRNPLQLRDALEMALLFQVVLYGVFYMKAWVGDVGLMASGFVLGLTDMDALTMSMTRSVDTGVSVDTACRAIALGIVANSLMKAGIAIVIGSARFKWQAGGALLAMAAAGSIALALF
jgi:uncharacterized membrane protein (DUF4010 family)